MDTFENENNRFDYSYPGIFSVSCDVSHNFIFGESENVYNSLVEILWKLRTGTFENAELQKDFQRYSEECFRFTPLQYGEELVEKEVRLCELKKILKKYGRSFE